MLTRRRFLSVLPAFAVTTHGFGPFRKKKAAAPLPVRVYFGTDTSKGASKGIYESRWNPERGELSAPVLAAATTRPSFLAISPSLRGQRFLYAVNAVNDPGATVTSFACDLATGGLSPIGRVPSGGAGPAYISVDSTGRAAFVANYSGSSIASFRIQEDGALSQPVERIDFKDHARFGELGPNAARQDVPHPHSVNISPDDRFLLVDDLGTDHISVFLIDAETARLSTSEPHLFTNDRPGSGPRHLVFHPNGRWIYGINEIDSTIDHYLWTETHALNPPQGLLVNTNTAVKTIAPGFPAEKNTAAEVAVSPDGNFLYASNRGEDTLVVFAIRPRDGRLSLVQRISCGGKTPRQFAFDPMAEWLVCGNQDSATVTVFRRHADSGRLAGPTQTVLLDSPLFALFV